MADKPKVVARNTARPGVKGAIHDLVEAVAKATAPRAVKERRVKLKEEEDAAMGRMREGQSTDSNNMY